MTERPKLTTPMMGTWAGFDTNYATRQSREEFQHLGAADALAHHHRAGGVDAMNLEYRLRYIQTNRGNFAHGRLPSMWFAQTQPPYGTSMPQSGRRPQHHSRLCEQVPATIWRPLCAESDLIVAWQRNDPMCQKATSRPYSIPTSAR